MRKLLFIAALSIATNLSFAQNVIFEEDTLSQFRDLRNSSVVFGDVDGDNDKDVLIAGTGIGNQKIMEIYLNNGFGVFFLDTNNSFDGTTNAQVSFVDLDNDGDQDFCVSGEQLSGTWGTRFYNNDSLGNYPNSNTGPSLTMPFFDFLDYDNDGDEDLLITGSGPIYLLSNDGVGNFTSISTNFSTGISYGCFTSADIDSDNDLDVLLTGNKSGVKIAELYVNDGSGSYSIVNGTPFIGAAGSESAFADIDNDNDQDVLITGLDTFNIPSAKIYTNNGSGDFTLVTGTPFVGVREGYVKFADIDNDSDLDVLIIGRDSSDVYISNLYINDGSGNYNQIAGMPFEGITGGPNSMSIAATDVNGDNYIDFILTGTNNQSEPITKLYINKTCYPNSSIDTQEACDSYTWINGVTYFNSNNTAIDTLINIRGCDSIVTLDLTILTLDTSLNIVGTTITSNSTGVSYQWINCDTNLPINGETNQSFTATTNGNYAVIIDNGICSDTSVCINFNTISINENLDISKLLITPNPSSSDFNINYTINQNSKISYTISDSKGSVISETQTENKTKGDYSININNLESGIYFIQFRVNNTFYSRKIIVNN